MAVDRFAGVAEERAQQNSVYKQNLKTFDERYKDEYSGGKMDQNYWSNITPTTYYRGKNTPEYQQGVAQQANRLTGGGAVPCATCHNTPKQNLGTDPHYPYAVQSAPQKQGSSYGWWNSFKKLFDY